jgi:serine/threonine-protein kinase
MNEIPATIGRYQVKRWIASGAMGEVFEAYDPIIDRPVAIKMLRRELAARGDSSGWLERFRHEARAAGRRIHPNIVAILDYGEQDGIPYLAMEYVEGETVGAALKRMGRFDQATAVAIISQVLSALEFAHANGVIHRDIKPSNILVPESGPIKVADFGIAHLESSQLTIDGDVLGTPSYMAPEQLSGAMVDHRADLYATGLVLYEMLTGEKASQNRSLIDLARTMRGNVPPDLWADHPEISPALRAVIDRALAFDPGKRYPRAAEFAHAVDAVVGLTSELPAASSQKDATVVATPRTAVPSAGSPIMAFAAETLAAVQHDLSTFIGPLARIAVQRAAARSPDIELLYRDLANLIQKPADRAAFIAKSGERAGSSVGAAAAITEGGADLPQIGAPPRANFPPDVLSRLEAGLAEHIGPIARVLVKQHLSRSGSVSDLCRELALFIPDEQARAQFLRSQSAPRPDTPPRTGGH